MASTVFAWLLGIPLLGLSTGMRTMTPIALCCWFAHFDLLSVQGTWASWVAHPVSVALFTLAALAEFVGDKLPRTPNRTAPVGLISRLAFGGLVGAIAATSLDSPVLIGAVLGVFSAVIGTFGSFFTRRDIVQKFRTRDWPVAVLEDLSAILIAAIGLRIVTL